MDTVPPVSLAQAPEAGPKYAYPPATKPIVNNIATKLLEDPRFYINVLHLMNKMDLPPPFTVKSLASEQPTMVTASMKVKKKRKQGPLHDVEFAKKMLGLTNFLDSGRRSTCRVDQTSHRSHDP